MSCWMRPASGPNIAVWNGFCCIASPTIGGTNREMASPAMPAAAAGGANAPSAISASGASGVGPKLSRFWTYMLILRSTSCSSFTTVDRDDKGCGGKISKRILLHERLAADYDHPSRRAHERAQGASLTTLGSSAA